MTEILKKIPTVVWVILIVILGLFIYWKSNDIGSWWEKRKQNQFDQQQIVLQQKIDQLSKERDQERLLRQQAEDRAAVSEAAEQLKSQEADALKKLIEDQGGKIALKEKDLEAIAQKYQEDQALIEAVKNGQVSKLDLCLKQCKDSADEGYPCRSNYCELYKGR